MNLIEFITSICEKPTLYNKSSDLYLDTQSSLAEYIEKAYQVNDNPITTLNKQVSFTIPFHDMGNINTTHLFGLDELIILSFYCANTYRYKNVLDLGANIGLHSVVLDKLGFQVTSFEADPETCSVLKNNLALNQSSRVNVINAAAGSFNGRAEFTRVCGNLTGSHLSGAKPNPYGKLEKFNVEVVNIGEIASQFDLIKIDIEGQEADVLTAIPVQDAKKIDFMLEINGNKNAKAIFDYSKSAGINIFLQKNNWKKVNQLSELPLSHRDGSVFISSKESIPWES